MILRAKTNNLIQTRELSLRQKANTDLNKKEMEAGELVLESKPQRLVFEMTNSCNLSCVMCGRNARNFKPVFFNKEWLLKFNSMADFVEEVTLMGWGEPTMHMDFCDFLKWANTYGIRKYFCTNGMKLGELMPAIFGEKIDVIAVSIDGATKEKNDKIRQGADFDRIIAGLKAIVNEKKRQGTAFPYMNFVTTLMKSNLYEFPEIVQLAADIGLEEAKCVFLTVFENEMIDESLYDSMDEVEGVFNEAREIAEKTGISIKLPHLSGKDPAGDSSHKSCRMLWRDFFLGSDGYVRPCMSTPIKLFHIDKYETFEEMWNSHEMVNFRKIVNNEEDMPNPCKNCYQSSFANWNKKSSFYQIGNDFSPEW